MYGIVPMTLSHLSMGEIPFCLKTIGKLLLNCTVTLLEWKYMYSGVINVAVLNV